MNPDSIQLEGFMKPGVLALSFLALAMPQPAMHADVFKLGAYNLSWVYSPKQNRDIVSRAVVKLNKCATQQQKDYSLVSDNALAGSDHNFTVVIDESKGAGTGYDVAYVKCKICSNPGKVYRVALAEDGSKTSDCVLHSNYSSPTPLDIVIDGAKAGRIKRPSAINVGIQNDFDQSKRATIELFGYMEGKIKTAAGDALIRLVDWNASGKYGDGSNSTGDSDFILLGKKMGSGYQTSAGSAQCQTANIPLLFDGNLYSIKIAPDGGKVTIGKYSGPSSKLNVTGVIESNKLTNFCINTLGDKTQYFHQPKLPVNLPPDRLFAIQISMDDDNRTLNYERQLHIVAGINTTVNMGGKLSLTILDLANAQHLSGKPGDSVTFFLDLSAGQNSYWVPQLATISFTDPDAQRVYVTPDNTNPQEKMSQQVRFTIPAAWKPGVYTIAAVAKVDGRNLIAVKKLHVTADDAGQNAQP